jgi:hypothetical protein
MFDWMLILATHVHNGSVVSFERFHSESECVTVKNYFVNSSGASLETNLNGQFIISCMKVRSLTN